MVWTSDRGEEIKNGSVSLPQFWTLLLKDRRDRCHVRLGLDRHVMARLAVTGLVPIIRNNVPVRSC